MKKHTFILLLPLFCILASFRKSVYSKEEYSLNSFAKKTDTLHRHKINIKGVNWADVRDNFINGAIVLSGLSASDNYMQVKKKAGLILSGFKKDGINTIRLPINPPTVSENWWKAYKAVADKALSKKMNVIFCCWEADSSRNGRVDNLKFFWPMWQQVINQYGKNSKVYFEVFNEPHGYNLKELKDLYVDFLAHYPTIPQNRILLSGTGYSEDVTKIGADLRFDGCLLALHDYSFFAKDSIKTSAEWENRVRKRIGAYANRTVITEFGARMTNGKDYMCDIKGDGEIAFIQGVTNVLHFDGISSVYWPGLRDKDHFSLYKFKDSKLIFTNASALQRLKFGWGMW